MPSSSPGQRLRDLVAHKAIQAPGVFNALAAKMAARAGFEAIYLSGAALSAATGIPDIGLLSLDEFTAAARPITTATALPLICDADTGFGETANVERTVREMEAAGVAAIHLEDQVLPKRCGHLSGKNLVSTDAMVSKVRAAVAARTDPGFLIIARTDARGVTSFADAVERANAYRAAGADMIFPEAMETAEEFAKFAQQVPWPLLANMTEFGKSPNLPFAELADMGYRIVIYPVSAFRAAMRAAQQTLEAIKAHGHQREVTKHMLTRQELYDLIDYADYEVRDRNYFGH